MTPRLLFPSPLSLFLCLLLLPTLAPARLGETYEQCVARYGKPTEEVPALTVGSLKAQGAIFHTKDNLEVFAIFHDGQAIQIAYSRQPAADLPAEQIQTLLADNSVGEKWTVLNPDATPNYWQTAHAFAVYDAQLRQLIFTSRAYYDQLQDFQGKVPTPPKT